MYRFRGIDFEVFPSAPIFCYFETRLYQVCYFTCMASNDKDDYIIGIPLGVISAVVQFSVELVNHKVSQRRRKYFTRQTYPGHYDLPSPFMQRRFDHII